MIQSPDIKIHEPRKPPIKSHKVPRCWEACSVCPMVRRELMQKFFMVLYAVFAFYGELYAQQQSTGLVVSMKESMLKFSKADKRKEAVVELRKAGYPAFKGLRSLAKDTGRGRDERIAAVILAGEIVKTSTAAPAADREDFRKDAEAMLAGDKDDFVREASAITLGKLADKSAIKSLKSALNDKSGNVRMRAAWALAKNGDYAGKEAALGGLKSDRVAEQVLAVMALEEMVDDGLLGTIRENLKSESTWTRINSALAIKRIEIKRTHGTTRIDYLENAMHDNQTEVQQWATKELSREIEEGGPNRDKSLAVLKRTAENKKSAASFYSGKILRRLIKESKVKESELER